MDLLIVGASARSAAQSARRVGLEPTGIDLFGDADLLAAGGSVLVGASAYPWGILDASEGLGDGPFLYTGALENQPALIDALARTRPLWGNPGDTLRAVRDPIAMAAALADRGLPAPDVCGSAERLPADGSWLAKPLRSAGGRRVRPYRGIPPDWPAYYQRRLFGPSLAALFVGRDDEARLMGVTEQILGGKHGCEYLGSVGPYPLADDRLAAIGTTLAGAFGLVGLFGVDLIWADGRPVPVEVNPRYTASVEVLELATGRSLLAEHIRACDPSAGARLRVDGPRKPPGGVVGKMIVFADGPFTFPEGPARRGRSEEWTIPLFADVPLAGTRIEAGQPVMTLMGRGDTAEDCLRTLRSRAACWRRRFVGYGSASC